MAVVDRVRDLVAPLAWAASVDVYDVEHNGGVVRVLVDAADGVDLGQISRLSRAVGRALDDHDAVPGRYTLEVSSPGLERPLRTPDHFRRAVGVRVKVKAVVGFEGPRRLSGVLEAADSRGVQVRDDGGLVHRIDYGEVSWARTVFEWRPSRGGSSAAGVGGSSGPRGQVSSGQVSSGQVSSGQVSSGQVSKGDSK